MRFEGEINKPSPDYLRGLADLNNNRITPEAMSSGLNDSPPKFEDLVEKIGIDLRIRQVDTPDPKPTDKQVQILKRQARREFCLVKAIRGWELSVDL